MAFNKINGIDPSIFVNPFVSNTKSGAKTPVDKRESGEGRVSGGDSNVSALAKFKSDLQSFSAGQAVQRQNYISAPESNQYVKNPNLYNAISSVPDPNNFANMDDDKHRTIALA